MRELLAALLSTSSPEAGGQGPEAGPSDSHAGPGKEKNLCARLRRPWRPGGGYVYVRDGFSKGGADRCAPYRLRILVALS